MITRAAKVLQRRIRLLRDGVLGLGDLSECAGILAGEDLQFFFPAKEKAKLVQRFIAYYPNAAHAVITAADAACRHEFAILGIGIDRPSVVGNRESPPSISWHVDPVADRRWKKRYSALLPVRYNSDESDIKRVWELSRCQHFAMLGQAYALTGDEKFAREWVAQMTEWDQQNPPLIGPNWMAPMEAAIRIVNWIWGYAFMGDSPAFTDEARKVFYRNLLSHGRFILRHLEGYGNHRFSNFVGLVWLGVLFPEFKEANEWREVGLKGFREELEHQVRSDGVHFEGSIPYHRLVLEMAATTWLLLRRNGIELSSSSQDAITRMFHFAAAYLQPNGFAPQVGDADDGRLQELTPLDKRDHSYLLSLAAALTGKSEFKLTPRPHPEAFWLLGLDGLKAYDALPAIAAREQSRAFVESGFYVLKSNRVHALVSCRQPHADDVGAHAHNDHLSFTLAIDGVEFIVDSGTYTYTGDLAVRDLFRSTSAHNTIMVDGQEINPFRRKDPFRLKDRANCCVLEWRAGEEEDLLTAEHQGYARLGVGVRRTFRHDRHAATLRITDSVSGAGVHELQWRFRFAPEVKVKLAGSELLAFRGGRSLVMSLPASPGMSFQLASGWYSPSYGVRQATKVAVWEMKGPLPVECRYSIQGGQPDSAQLAPGACG